MFEKKNHYISINGKDIYRKRSELRLEIGYWEMKYKVA